MRFQMWFDLVPATEETLSAMSLPIALISTDFDGTLFAEFENPPVPGHLQDLIAGLQRQGVKWVINTGRELSSLFESMSRAHLRIKPDYLVVVEREIFVHRDSQYVELPEWNRDCDRAHEELFAQVRLDLPRLMDWVGENFASATVYEDDWSPFCLIAEKPADAAIIHEYLDAYCQEVPHLTVVRNDVYARFSHEQFTKGTALREIARRLGISAEQTLAAGDHLNDLSMLSLDCARYLVTPSNAVDEVKEAVRRQAGYISPLAQGHGVADGVLHHLRTISTKSGIEGNTGIRPNKPA